MIGYTVEDLRARAERDLRHPREGVLLDWAFLQSEAAGAVEAAREWMGFCEHRYRDIKSVVMGKWAPDEESPRMKDLYQQMVELEAIMSKARGELAYAVQCLRSTELVMELLKRRKLPPAAIVPIRRAS